MSTRRTTTAASPPATEIPEPLKNAPDGLALLVQHSIDNDPGFAEVWAPLAFLSQLIDERIRLGLSQAEVAERMGVARSAIAKLESDPSGVAFARILAYAKALGVEFVVKPSKQKPKVSAPRAGRPVSKTKPKTPIPTA